MTAFHSNDTQLSRRAAKVQRKIGSFSRKEVLARRSAIGIGFKESAGAYGTRRAPTPAGRGQPVGREPNNGQAGEISCRMPFWARFSNLAMQAS